MLETELINTAPSLTLSFITVLLFTLMACEHFTFALVLSSNAAIAACSLSNLSEQDAVEQELRLHLVLGDVSVGVHAEDFWRWVQWE